MPELISESTRKARKSHKCGLCSGTIEKGETYHRQFLKWYGDVYTFKEHSQCRSIVGHLWRYADPEDGMTGDDFVDTCHSYCNHFVCPHCEHWDETIIEGGYEGCSAGQEYCLDKILARLEEYGLKKDGYKWIEYKREVMKA